MMDAQPKAMLTQRSYTLRLAGVDDSDDSWRDALWATHEAVNKGAKAFGDWLLTLRGGLHHALATAKVPGSKGNAEREPTRDEVKNRRVLLALSWLSVEDEISASVTPFMLASGKEAQSDRDKKVLEALREILQKRSVSPNEIAAWTEDCRPSISAAVRKDAAWVNRSAAFDSTANQTRITRESARAILEYFFGPVLEFLSLPVVGEKDETGEGVGARQREFREPARGWVSRNFGSGRRSNLNTIAERLSAVACMPLHESVDAPGHHLAQSILQALGGLPGKEIDEALDAIAQLIGWQQRKSRGWYAIERVCRKSQVSSDDVDGLRAALKKEVQQKRQKSAVDRAAWADTFRQQLEEAVGVPYTTARDCLGEYGAMLDLAARRFSSAHSWVKRAEATRRQAEANTMLLGTLRKQYPAAVDWLDRYCERRSADTGVQTDLGYVIRRRAIQGWERVVAEWQRCTTVEDRITAVRLLQDDREVEKFGDPRLFEDLAQDDAVCVWRTDGEPAPCILIDYVAGTKACVDRQRFKVPMYRHPDSLSHPVFCEFGESRWAIRFAVHRQNGYAGAKGARSGEPNRVSHLVTLGLVTSGTLRDVNLRWRGKRLQANLAGHSRQETPHCRGVTRNDRLSRAVADAGGVVSIMNVFDEKEWNGRLQAPRAALERIAKLLRNGKAEKALALRRRVPWLLTFSPRLRPQGPWVDYASKHGLLTPRTTRAGTPEVPSTPGDDKDAWRGLAYPMWHPANEKGRKGLAKHILSRLPGLRILSVDLGHRFAAACAVWLALSKEDFEKAVQGKKIVRGGLGPADLYAHVEEPTPDGRAHTVIYRRTGPDELDGKPHPAPWARLERQFLIKLQGEDEEPRKAGPHEIELVRQAEQRLGRVRTDHDPLPRRVDELMSEAIRTARLALRRHGDRARIAFAMTAQYKPMPGGKKLHFEWDRAQSAPDEFDKGKSQQERDNMRVEHLTDALDLWHGLAAADRWRDDEAAALWRKHIEGPYGLALESGPPASKPETALERKKRREALRQKLKGVAQKLAGKEEARNELQRAWSDRWKMGDKEWGGRDGVLKRLHRWVLPRGIARTVREVQEDGSMRRRRVVDRAKLAVARHVGGLSLTRINTLTDLYRLLKAYRTRPEPGDPRKNVPQEGDETLRGFHRRLLTTRDRLREQRVKQLASRIAEAALGIGRFKRPRQEKGRPPCKDPKRPTERVDAPCHAVVIENLTHYRPDELQTRRENRQLMSWSSSKVKKRLAEACQLHGLHLREVLAAYTSRQDSRTGAPGLRCSDVSVSDFMSAPRWRRRVATAREKPAAERDALDNYLIRLDDRWSRTDKKDWPEQKSLRIPDRGGGVFVSAAEPRKSDKREGPPGLQADLNAAANIGLRALMDPDWPGRWWYVPCSEKDGTPVKDKVGGCPLMAESPALLRAMGEHRGAAKPRKSGARRAGDEKRKDAEIVNAWRDPVGTTLQGDWMKREGYWRKTEDRVVGVLEADSRRPEKA